MDSRQQIVEDFYAGRTHAALRFVKDDQVLVLHCPHSGRIGYVCAIDTSQGELRFLVDFADGTDEFIAESALQESGRTSRLWERALAIGLAAILAG